MRSLDPRLTILAKDAGVRPPHVWMVVCHLKELGGLFDAEVCAAFCQLEVRHVERIVAVLTERGILPKVRTAKNDATRQVPSSRLTLDFTLPQEWLDYAQQKRFWTPAESLEEAESFVTYWAGCGRAMVDWRATWQGWVRRSNRPSGQKPFEGTVDQAAFYARQIASLRSQGRDTEADQWQKTLDGLSGNVLPFRSVG